MEIRNTICLFCDHSPARQCLHCCKSDQPILRRYADFGGSELLRPIDEKFGEGDYIGDNSPHAKIKNDRLIEGVVACA